MMPLRLFASREFRAVNAASFLLSFAMFAAFIMIVQFLSSVRGEGPVSAGLHTLFWTLMPMVVAPFSARLAGAPLRRRSSPPGSPSWPRASRRWPRRSAPDASALALAPGLLITGIGVGLVIPNLAAGALGAVPRPTWARPRDPQHVAPGRRRVRRVGRRRDLPGRGARVERRRAHHGRPSDAGDRGRHRPAGSLVAVASRTPSPWGSAKAAFASARASGGA